MDNKGQSNQAFQPQAANYPPPDDFISLRDIIKQILKHRRKIATFTLLITATAAVIFLALPRKYGAEAMLQVIEPENIIGEAPDQDAREANILSHLEYLRSSFLASIIAEELTKRGMHINLMDLRSSVNIDRPPRTNLLRITAESKTEEDALLLADLWRRKYLELLVENSFHSAILALKREINRSLQEWLDKKGRAEEIRNRAELEAIEKVITLTRTISDSELSRRLADGADAGELKKLSEIHFKNQHINEEYYLLKNLLLKAEQEAASARYSFEFYSQALKFLELDAPTREPDLRDEPEKDGMAILAAQHAQRLLDMRDIFPVGSTSLVLVSRGAFTKTIITFIVALFGSSMIAFLYEWLKD